MLLLADAACRAVSGAGVSQLPGTFSKGPEGVARGPASALRGPSAAHVIPHGFGWRHSAALGSVLSTSGLLPVALL